MNRREFLRRIGATTAAAGFLSSLHRRADAEPSPASRHDHVALNDRISATARGKMPTRPLGRLGVDVGILGLGTGFLFQASGKESAAIINAFIDAGGNYIDTASQYGGGKSESLIGEALRERRKDVFLATKILQRSQSATKTEFADSLKRLKTDYVDLLQIHAVNSDGDFDAVFGPEGSLKTALEAHKDGRARYIGITGHTRPKVILRALEKHPFDVVLVPVGLGDTVEGDFSDTVLSKAREKGIATIGMKLLGMKSYIADIGVATCLQYSLALPVDTGIVGMTSVDELNQSLAVVNDLQKPDDKKLAEAREKAGEIRAGGALWWKKA